MTDERLWGAYNYMPRTRDLSKYRRALPAAVLRETCSPRTASPSRRRPRGAAEGGTDASIDRQNGTIPIDFKDPYLELVHLLTEAARSSTR
jgi:hypothetical protein